MTRYEPGEPVVVATFDGRGFACRRGVIERILGPSGYWAAYVVTFEGDVEGTRVAASDVYRDRVPDWKADGLRSRPLHIPEPLGTIFRVRDG